MGHTDSFVKDFSHFLKKLVGMRFERGDMLVRFNVVSLFTMVPVQEVWGIIGELFPADIASLYSDKY